MGIRVDFSIGSKDGLEGFVLQEIQGFLNWYEKALEEYPSDHDLEILNTANEILSKGHAAFNIKGLEAAKEVDKFVSSFLGEYCDYGDGVELLKEAHESMLRIENYRNVKHYFDEESHAAFLWKCILQGRSIARGPVVFPFYSDDDIFRVSYVRFNEIDEFKSAIENLLRINCDDTHALKATNEALSKAHKLGLGLIITVG